MSELEGTKAVVVGASRGFGRGIVEALVEAGAEVHALSRGDASEVVRATGGRAHAIRADAAHPETPSRILREIEPTVVVLNAGATPQIAPFREQTWDAFSTNWNVDVKIVVASDGDRLGVVRVSRGSIDWKPGKAKRTWSLTWEQFDDLMRAHGHPPR